MALNVSLVMVDPYLAAGRNTTFQVAITNTSSSSVTLTQVNAYEATESDAKISVIRFQTPNVPVGVGNPTVLAGATAYYCFDAVFPGPATPGPSPNISSVSGGLGSGGMFTGQPAESVFTLQVQAQASDGSVGTGALTVAAITATPVFPQSLGGSMQFSNPFNAIHLL